MHQRHKPRERLKEKIQKHSELGGWLCFAGCETVSCGLHHCHQFWRDCAQHCQVKPCMCVAGMGEVVQPTLIAVLLVGCRKFMAAQIWILDTAMTIDESLQSKFSSLFWYIQHVQRFY